MGADTYWIGVDDGAVEASVCAGGDGTGSAGETACTGDGVEEVFTCIPTHGIMADVSEHEGEQKRVWVAAMWPEKRYFFQGEVLVCCQYRRGKLD